MKRGELLPSIERGAVYTITGLMVTAIVATCVTLWRRPGEA